jgi:hypothetical protein
MEENMNEHNLARKQARAQFESIKEMIENLKKSPESENIRQEIFDYPLCIQHRSDWTDIGGKKTGGGEFLILLCTGGPACRITGELNEHNDPASAILQYQDWGTPWTEYSLNCEDTEILIEYCHQFYFGE